jgi:hypothetical protein
LTPTKAMRATCSRTRRWSWLNNFDNLNLNQTQI